MNRLSLPITEIQIVDRQRELNHEHVKSLAESIKDLGLVQPIVINQDKRLIAGGHRLAAHKLLGLTSIDVVYKETLNEDELQELELTENVKRVDLRWQEVCLAVSKIHFLKLRRSALNSKSWGERDTGKFLNVNQANIHYSLIIAKELVNDETKEGEFWKASNFNEAYSLILKRNEDAALARLAGQQMSNVFDLDDSDIVKGESLLQVPKENIDLTQPLIIGYRNVLPPLDNREPCKICSANPDPDCIHCLGEGIQWKDKEGDNGIQCEPIYEDSTNKEGLKTTAPEILLSRRYIKGDSITLMNSPEWKEKFDHIITDIPFGIDIDYIDQSNSIKNIGDIKAEHTVEGNLELHAQFFKAAFNCIKPQGFCITWLDIMQWQRMFDLAEDAGFKVTRWPFYWCKTYPCLNQMSQYNFTKSVEVAMICRKGNVTLPEKQPNNYILCGKDELSDGHPFAKPFNCWERLITAVSLQNQTILDPFCGSGSCYKSGVKLGRVMVGVEKDEALYNSGLESIKQFYLQMNPKIIFV